MKLKNLCCAWWLCLLPTLLFAQVDKEYQEYVKQMQKEYNNYVDEQNKEFAKFLKETWEAYDLMRQVPRPVRPEPVKPTVFDTTKPPAKPIRIKIEEVPKPVPVIPVRSKPVPNISSPQPGEVEVIIPDKPVKPRVGKNYTTLQFYNVPYAVSHALKNKLHLKEISEKAVSEGWETLAGGNYQTLIEDCMVAKAEMTLSDYGFLMLTRQVATELCGDDSPNEVAFMQMFILCQAGFKSKVARVDNRLVLLYATDVTIYGVYSITLAGT
ncbi:MAG: hypothetical protein LBM62_03640, partial [Mediterranea sp.]|nr:hypothetical protein [Mediterranea sp.]